MQQHHLPADKSLLLNVSYVCPEPVLINVRFFSIKMTKQKGISAPALPKLDGLEDLCLADLGVGRAGSAKLRVVKKRQSFLNFSYVCPKPVLVK